MQGTGILCFDSKFQPEPLIFGGTGSDSENPYQPAYYPDRLESGTQNAPGIIALSAAIDWWKKDSINRLKRIKELSDYLREELNSLPDVKVYSVPNYSGIVSFNLIGRDSNEVGDLLANKYGIATRSGLHCAPLIHKHLGTFPDGMVRLSVSGENTMEECEYFVESLRQIIAAH
jgi:cysteine desulfurase/selenocysteine lyase